MKKEKKKKGIQNTKEEVRLLVFEVNIIINIENLKSSTKPVGTNKLSKVGGYKINIQKLVAFLYTNNELAEKLRNQLHL